MSKEEDMSNTFVAEVGQKSAIFNQDEEIEKTIEEHLAFNDQICWFCGANGSTHQYKKPYSYSVSEQTWNGTPQQICAFCRKHIFQASIKLYGKNK